MQRIMAVLFTVFIVILRTIRSEVIDLSCDQIKSIVDKHNEYRQQLATGGIVDGQPAAANMNSMAWDDELAAKANDWASNGQFEHNPDNSIESQRFQTGENIYYYSTTDEDYNFDVASGVSDWFSEYKDYTFAPLTNEDFQRKPEIGHYTQMVWAKSEYIGCGVDQRSSNGWTTYLLVCNYGPAGNMIGEEPYQVGDGNQELNCDGDVCDHPYGGSC